MALGLVLQQALIISTLVFLAILALWTQAGPILLLAGEITLHFASLFRQMRLPPRGLHPTQALLSAAALGTVGGARTW